MMLYTQRIDYPKEIVDWLTDRKTISFTSRTGNVNSVGSEFNTLLHLHGLSHLYQNSLSDSRTLILNGLFDRECPECGSKIRGEALRRLAEYCDMVCYKKSPIGRQKISDKKSSLYADPEWKSATESKKISTCLEHHGVEYPMQSPAIHQRHEKSSKQAYSYRGIDGLRGYERYAVDWFIDDLGFAFGKHFLLGSDARVRFNQRIIVNSGHRYPDFYVVPWNTYVEIKSEYTLSKFDSFDAIYDIVEDLGSDYIIICYNGSLRLVDQYTKELVDLPTRYSNYNLTNG